MNQVGTDRRICTQGPQDASEGIEAHWVCGMGSEGQASVKWPFQGQLRDFWAEGLTEGTAGEEKVPRLPWAERLGGLLLPGLNRMIARRQPSSVLSILMSRILDTSSVSTLERDLQVTQRSQLSQPWTRTSL